jgi:predicted dehydrogenase
MCLNPFFSAQLLALSSFISQTAYSSTFSSALSVEASFSLNIKNDTGSIELFGTKAGAKLDPGVEIYSEISDYLVDIVPSGDTALNFNGLFENEIAHFVACVNGAECISPAEDGVELMRIIDAVYESAATGRDVLIKR